MRPALVLAAAPETLIGVAFVVISLISGLLNYLNSRAKPKAPNNRGAGRPVRPRSERIQSEIEQFMREQVRKQEGDAPAGQRSQPQPEPRSAPQAKPLPQRRPSATRGPAPRQVARKPEPPRRPPIGESSQQPATVRPGEEFSHRKLIGSEGLGQGLREHLKTAMVERVQAESQVHLGSGVSQDVARHLGTFAAGATALAPSVQAPQISRPALADELRSREGMRRALIAQMILERPASLRRDRS